MRAQRRNERCPPAALLFQIVGSQTPLAVLVCLPTGRNLPHHPGRPAGHWRPGDVVLRSPLAGIAPPGQINPARPPVLLVVRLVRHLISSSARRPCRLPHRQRCRTFLSSALRVPPGVNRLARCIAPLRGRHVLCPLLSAPRAKQHGRWIFFPLAFLHRFGV